ncbi:hypothetical protein [Umezawaea sp. Da 62-37]|uniref:hypothetical protein n=1 Tax=Umezawaea sp. Da 62-37 TaxID=3075927 RepID=UPI0028F6FB4B|nr:hypothetical protein [Umezawaea sp. Da 62-37]WNV86555.1 hypothetical protein RM788_52005 [Umezawaea sp. Da 62-37]
MEATRRWAADGITANALMPGAIDTNVLRNMSPEMADAMRDRIGVDGFWKTPAQGASTSALVATSPLLKGIGGRYFQDNQEALPHTPPVRDGVASYALDPAVAARLWDVSLEHVRP